MPSNLLFLKNQTPELAIIPPETKRVLERLCKFPDVHVAIISGRQLDDLERKVSGGPGLGSDSDFDTVYRSRSG